MFIKAENKTIEADQGGNLKDPTAMNISFAFLASSYHTN